MMKRIAVVCCVSLLIQTTASAAAPGPLSTASLAKDPQQRFRADTATSSRPVSSDDDNQATGTWMERHPVWMGAIVGFSAGFLLTYAVAASEDHTHQLLTPVDPGGPALVWGGVAAGIGALAGWGIGRSRDKNPNPAAGTTTAVGHRAPLSGTGTAGTPVVEQPSQQPRD